jgi:uracil-DNA glycosylase
VTLTQIHQQVTSCTACARLRAHCTQIAQQKRAAFRNDMYWGRPVPGFGDPQARLLVLGLAPGAHGANRTGRMFTGDSSGAFLMRAMHAAGFANEPFSRDRSDGLRLQGAYILAAVRCAPPDNKPTPDEIATCQPHLEREWAALPRIQVVVALGRLAFAASHPHRSPRSVMASNTRSPVRRMSSPRSIPVSRTPSPASSRPQCSKTSSSAPRLAWRVW